MDLFIKIFLTYLNDMDSFSFFPEEQEHTETFQSTSCNSETQHPQLLLKIPRTIRTMQGPTKLYAA